MRLEAYIRGSSSTRSSLIRHHLEIVFALLTSEYFKSSQICVVVAGLPSYFRWCVFSVKLPCRIQSSIRTVTLTFRLSFCLSYWFLLICKEAFVSWSCIVRSRLRHNESASNLSFDPGLQNNRNPA